MKLNNISTFRCPIQEMKFTEMKLFFLLLFTFLLSINVPAKIHSIGILHFVTDTSKINHSLDGKTAEWPPEIFEQNKATGIKYALNNDANNLYVAVMVMDFNTQIKMMRGGMKLYIDTKGKKKQENGIEFPVRKDLPVYNNNNSQHDKREAQNSSKQKPDMKLIRSRMAPSLLSLKIFGFYNQEPVAQDLMESGSVNIQFSWDGNDIMYIEYKIPLDLLGDKISLNKKTISLGWELVDVIVTTTRIVSQTTRVVSVPAGSTPPRTLNSGRLPSGMPGQETTSTSTKEQSFWVKYIISIN